MSKTPLSPELLAYAQQTIAPPTALQQQLIEETATLAKARMQIDPKQGPFMAMMANLLGAKIGLEIGTFTGYSSLCLAPCLQKLHCLDVDEEATVIAQRYWQAAGLNARIQLHLGQALETLNNLTPDLQGQLDLAFIDADKVNYWAYLQALVPLMRPNGLIMVDNTLWGGRVLDSQDQSEDTQAIRDFNQRLAKDARFEHYLLPIGDGLTLIRPL